MPFLKKSGIILLLGAALLTLGEIGYRITLKAKAAFSSAGPNAFDLYAIGGSSALGMPYPVEISFPSLTSKMFDEKIGGRAIAVHNLARLGDSIYPEALRLRRNIKYRDRSLPATVLIYSGHNEKFSRPASLTGAFRFWQALKEKWIYRSLLLSDAICLVERRLRLRGLRDMRTYEFYLRRSIEEAQDAGAVPILSTVIGNVSGLEPQISAPGITQDQIASLIAQGLSLEKKGAYRQAVAYYSGLSRRMAPLAPLLFYRIGRCHQSLGEFEAARKYYWDAIEADPKADYGRATARQNDLIRDLAKEYSLPLVDAVKLFEARSAHGLVGNDLFVDINHPNMTGYLMLAHGFARAVSERFRHPLSSGIKTPEDAYSMTPDGKKWPAHEYIWSGIWHTAYAYGHPCPISSLRFAEESYKKALRLRPDHYWSWVGLGLVQAARSRIPSVRNKDAAWIVDVLFHPKSCIPEETGKRIEADFKKMGIEKSTLDNLRRVSLGPHSQFCASGVSQRPL